MRNDAERAREEWAARLKKGGYPLSAASILQNGGDPFYDITVETIVSFASPPTTGGDMTQGDREALEAFAERLDACPEDTSDIAFASIDMTHGEVRSVRSGIRAALATAQAAEGEFVGVHEAAQDLIAAKLMDCRTVGYRDDLWNCLAAALLAQPTTDPVSREAAASEPLDRSPPQFFFEVGYGACWAEAFVRNDSTPPFPLTDAVVERAWEIAREAHDDPEEFDRYLAALRALPAAQAGRVDRDILWLGLAAAKVVCLTYGNAHRALHRVVRLAIDAGINSSYNELTADPRIALLVSDAPLADRQAALSPPSADGEEG